MANKGAWPWLRLFSNDYVLETLPFSSAEGFAYSLLICSAWDQDGELPNDLKQLALIGRTTPKNIDSLLKKCEKTQLAYFVGTSLRFRWVDKELARARRQIEQRQKAGKKSAEARSTRPQDIPGVLEEGEETPTPETGQANSSSQSEIQRTVQRTVNGPFNGLISKRLTSNSLTSSSSTEVGGSKEVAREGRPSGGRRRGGNSDGR
jgi:uncharacterized protein YdaU (DUF1376 family)